MTAAKKFVTWSEPSFFKAQERAYNWPPRYAHVAFAVVTLFFIILTLVLSFTFPEPKDISIYLGVPAMGAVFGALTGYGISLMDLKAPAIVAVDVAGVSRMDSVIPMAALFRYRTSVFHWPSIARGQLDPAADDRLSYILTVFDEADSVLDRLGVVDSVDITDIRVFFDQQDKPLTEASAAV